MSAAPKVSVLLPTHRRTETLRLAIDSVLSQTFPDFELLVVLDGAGAETRAVMDRFSDPRIRVHDLPKAPGNGHANRQTALDEARGSVVAYQQDDDIWFPDHLERLVALFRNESVLWAHARSFWVTADGLMLPNFANAAHGTARRQIRRDFNMIASSMVAHRTDALRRAGGWAPSGEPGEDWRLWQRMFDLPAPNRARCARAPSVFHFRSDMGSPGRWPRFLGGLHALSHSGNLPSALRLEDDRDPRIVVAERLASEGPRFAAMVRSAFDRIQDDIAWAWGSDPLLR